MIGVGRIASLHRLGYVDNPRAELYAICDADPTLLRRRSAEWEVDKTFEDYRRLLDDPQVDAVEVITPHHLHAELTIAALEAGKHVSVQKPMALNLADAGAMVRAGERSGKLLRVIENYRYYGPFARAKELIDAGDIGEPLSIRLKSLTGDMRHGWEIPESAQSWRSDASRSGEGSIVFDHGQHIWSLTRFFMGDVERVFAYIGRTEVVRHIELLPGAMLDSPAMVTWKYAGADKYGSWETLDSQDLLVRSKYYPLTVGLEITGSRGVLWVNHAIGRMLDRAPVEVYRDGVVRSFSDVETDYSTSFINGVRDFVDAVHEGRESGLTAAEGMEVLRLSLAVVGSGREGREVSLDEVVE